MESRSSVCRRKSQIMDVTPMSWYWRMSPAIWSASRVAGRSLWLRVTVVKSEKRTLMVTVRARSAFRALVAHQAF